MKLRMLVLVIAAVLVAGLSAHDASAWSRPQIVFSAGQTFGADGSPSDGGLSAAVTPTWPAGDHARFGVSLFADDIGTDLGTLFDPNDHTVLGTVGLNHRWAWGAAWRGDVDVMHRGRWTGSVLGTMGWTRIEDDRRGDVTNAASAVSLGGGVGFRRAVGTHHDLGVTVRWQRLFAERNASYRRVQQYAAAAVEWGWAGAARR